MPRRRVLLLVATLGYLLGEAWFNATLLDVAARSAKVADMQTIAHAGRLLAAIGAVLFAAKLAYGHAAPGPVRRRVPAALLIAGIVALGPLVYHGEKALIDTLVDHTDPGERVAAQYLALMRSGVAAGDVTLTGYPDTGAGASVGDRSFYVMMSAMLWHSPAALEAIRANRTAILQRIARRDGQRELDVRYAEFRRGVQALRDAYRRYTKAARKAERITSNPRAYARERWAKLYQRIAESGWDEYQAVQRRFVTRTEEAAKPIVPRLRWIWDHHKECVSRIYENDDAACRAIRKRYRQRASKLLDGGPVPELSWWCAIPGRADQVWNHILWGSHDTLKRIHCARDVETVALGLRRLKADEFRARSDGYGPFLKTREAFLATKATDRRVRAALRDRGVELPAGWTPAQPDVAIEAIAERVRAEAGDAYKQAVKDAVGVVLPRELSWQGFITHPAIRARLRERIGAEGVEKLRWDMTRAEFADAVIEPAIHHAVGTARRAIDRAVLYDPSVGRDAVYMVVVPPIALGASVLFMLLNAVQVIAWLLAAVVERTPVGRAQRARRAIVAGVTLALLAVVVIGPFVALPHPTTRPERVEQLLTRLGSRAGEPAALAARWVLRAEPVLYPLGRSVRCMTQGWQDCDDVERAVARLAPVLGVEGDGHGSLLATLGEVSTRGAMSPVAVRWIQSRLDALGLKPGPVDGLMGPKTRAAVARLRRDSVSLSGRGGRVDGAVMMTLSAQRAP